MRVVVVGATGFIGRQVTAWLLDKGFEVQAAVRNVASFERRFPGVPAHAVDLVRRRDPNDWEPALAGADAVVNCAGVLERDAAAVHVDGTLALFEGARAAGVGRIVHVSAISVGAAVPTDYAATKRTADAALQAMAGIEWTILRPSLVYGAGAYGGTSLLRGLAALPLRVPLPGDGGQLVSPIHVADLCRAIEIALATDRVVGRTLEPAGPETIPLKDYLRRLRAWLDLPPARAAEIPTPLVYAAARVGGWLRLDPLNLTSIRQIEAGNAGDGDAFAAAIGFRPATMAEAFRRAPSSGQDKQAARAYFLKWAVWPLGLFAAVGALLAAVGVAVGVWLLGLAASGGLALAAAYVWAMGDER